ncbi:MAG: winged helix-turn-helix domain-containing protein [Brevundimonas sp.]
MTPPVFDSVIHAPGRLQICAILSATDEAEFAMVREAIAVSDSVLSKHLKQLEEAGYIKLRKQASDGRQRTWLAMLPAGRKAFTAHVTELQRLAAMTVHQPLGQGFSG